MIPIYMCIVYDLFLVKQGPVMHDHISSTLWEMGAIATIQHKVDVSYLDTTQWPVMLRMLYPNTL